MVRLLGGAVALLFLSGVGGALTVEDGKAHEVPGVNRSGDPSASAPTAGASDPQTGQALSGSAPATKPSKKNSTKSGSSGESREPGAEPTSDKGERPQRITSPQRDPRSTMPLEVTVTPDCAERKQSVTVRGKTRPFASVAAAVSYSDYKAHGSYTLGAAGTGGEWVWTFVVPDSAPNGRGEILVAAGDRSGAPDQRETTSNGDGASVRMPFNVSDKCS